MLRINRHFSPFKLFLDRDSGTALMLNPKVLSTYIREWLADGVKEHRGMADPSGGRWPFLSLPRRFPVAPLRDYWSFVRDPGQFETFAFVRNPYGRVMSAWKNKFFDSHSATPDGRDSAYPRSIKKAELPPLRAFARARGLAGGAPNTVVPFETFLHYAVAQGEGRRNHHWESQVNVLMCGSLSYRRVFRIETELAEGFQLLGRRLGFPEDWVTARLGHRANASRSSTGFYTPELAALAQPLVAEDLKQFGYDPDSWRDFAAR